jgi:hypothetical protein
MPLSVGWSDCAMTEPTRKDRLEAWYDGSAICVIAVGSRGDPLDLGEHEVENFIKVLQSCLHDARRGEETSP